MSQWRNCKRTHVMRMSCGVALHACYRDELASHQASQGHHYVAPGMLTRGSRRAGAAPLSVMVAAGPFTTADSLEFEPLDELLAVAARTPPVSGPLP